MKYLVSTTIHSMDGTQVGNWEGAYLEAETKEQAEKEAVEWEENLLLLAGACDVEADGTTIYHKVGDEEFYTVVMVD